MARRTPPEVVERVVQLRREGKSYREIGEVLSIGTETARRYGKGIIQDVTAAPQHKVRRIMTLRQQGKSYKEISKEVGLHPHTVRKYCRDRFVDAAVKVYKDTSLDLERLLILQELVRKVSCVGCEEAIYFLASTAVVRCPSCLAAFPVQQRKVS